MTLKDSERRFVVFTNSFYCISFAMSFQLQVMKKSSFEKRKDLSNDEAQVFEKKYACVHFYKYPVFFNSFYFQ